MKRLLPIVLGLAAMAASHACAADAAKPNFLFIIADDCTFRDIGCYGGQAHTPNIDKLAGEGMRMTHCFQAAPMCSPTRHNIYTGQYPVKTGAYPNHTETYPDVKNITHYLKPLGYRVALSGKTHIGPREVFDFEYSGNRNPDMQAVDQLMSQCASENTPMCLFACSNEPHTPWNQGDPSRYPPESIKLPPYIPDTPVVRDGYSRYLAEITYFDDQVGQLLQMLDKHQLSDNTLVMVVSEQGNSMPFAKWTCYDNGLQSAMVVRWPGKVKPGSVTDAMVEYVDVTPTFVDAAGGTPAPALDGKSMMGVLTGATDEHKQYVYGIMTTKGIINGNDSYPIRSVRSRTHKLILNLQPDQTFTNACTKSPEFLSMVEAAKDGDEPSERAVLRYQHRPAVEFYDVINDPLEMHNLADHPEFADEIAVLRKELESWMKSQGDQGVETERVANAHKKKRTQAKNAGKRKKRRQ
ncbi:sulfatase [Roseiconus nitratireducens]|uniref:Sulfatase n=1 Tax=Roseiconus nitratireducens TaxID=2605748 RepID=A0A5M6D4U1_9BACT|nr:sulfatase [Roseiconus nitratireducens]KAA5541786.1 sulfatase [Roseiconus nitratireducens]